MLVLLGAEATMIHDLLTEYAKVIDWYIQHYQGREIEQGVKYNPDENRWEVWISFLDDNGAKWIFARYLEYKWLKTDYYNAMKANVYYTCLKYIEEKSNGSQSGYFEASPSSGE